jgi:hypothetical protein
MTTNAWPSASPHSHRPLPWIGVLLFLAVVACNGSAAPTSAPTAVPPSAVQVLTPVVVTNTPVPTPSATLTAAPSATPTMVLIPASDTPQPASTAQGACDNLYLPVRPGAKWTYAGSVAGASFTKDWTQVDTITTVRASDFQLRLTFPDKTLDEQWSCRADGLLSYSPDDGLFSAIGQGPSGSATVQTTAVTGITLPAHISLGDVWQEHAVLQVNGKSGSFTVELMYQARAVVNEQVSVAAGSFNALHLAAHGEILIHSGGGIQTVFDGTQWMAPGVGLVKRTGTLTTTPGGQTAQVEFELTSYSIP